jgi:hypothetical protein
MTGTAAFSPALPRANAAGSTTTTAFTLTALLSHCNNSHLRTGAAPITGGSVTLTGTLDPGASCADLLSAPEDLTTNTNGLLVTLLRRGTAGTVIRTRLRSTITDESLTDDSGYDLTGWTYASDALTSPTLFINDTVTLALRVDNFQALGGCIVGRTDLPSVSFSAGRSYLAVAP